MVRVLSIIPARGGSERLRRKNLLPIDGIPLVVRAARTALPGRVVVSTDDDEIAGIALSHGFDVHRRGDDLAAVNVPELSSAVARDLAWNGAVMAIQPTVQPLSRANVRKLSEYSEPAILTVLNDTHITWETASSTRILDPREQELGVYFWPKGTVGDMPVNRYLVDEPTIDIDTAHDYLAAVNLTSKKHIVIDAAEPTTWTGTGHHRRMETLALFLQHHDVRFEFGKEDYFIPDLVIRDRGDSEVFDILPHKIRGSKVMVFEDQGPGAAYADLAINAILPPSGLANERSGGDWAIIRPEFLGLTNVPVDSPEALIIFGGTDAKNFTPAVAAAAQDAGFRPVTPNEARLPTLLSDATVLVSGAGQIVDEAAYMGVPNVVIAATQREANHGHLGAAFGNLFLGIGTGMKPDLVRTTLFGLLADEHLREEMSQRSQARVDGRGLERVLWEIERVLRNL